MNIKSIIEKLEILYPKIEPVPPIRPGACFIESYASFFLNDNYFENLQAGYDNLPDEDYCKIYNNDCIECQKARGLEIKGPWIVTEKNAHLHKENFWD